MKTVGIQRRILKPFILFLGDAAACYSAVLLMALLRHGEAPLFYYLRIHLPPFSIIFAIWIFAFFISGLYELRNVKNIPSFYDRLYKVFIFNAAASISVFYLLPYFRVTPRINLFIVLATVFLLITAWRFFAQRLMASRGRNRILFFGFSKEVIELSDFLKQNPQLGYLPAAAMAAEEEAADGVQMKIYSFNHNLPDVVADNGVEIIVASSAIKKNETLIRMLFQAVPLGIPVVDFLSFYEAVTGKIPVSLVGEVWFLENLVGVKKEYYEFFKRITDIAASLLLGVPSLILFPLVALAIAMDSPGPIFYFQKRVGRGGKEFSLIKYRTMIKDAEQMGWSKGAGPDPRHTRVGKILRKSYLDELPQIVNVIRGEMSFVGPRPERPKFVQELSSQIPFYEMRLMVKPGITGWAQVNMENDASVEDALEKLQYDLSYIKNRSAWLDLEITLKTARTILSRGGR